MQNWLKIIWSIVNSTFGKSIRIFQLFLSPSRTKIVNPTVAESLELDSIKVSVDYAKRNMQNAMVFNKLQVLWDYCCGLIDKGAVADRNSIIFLEFGVHSGGSINHFAKHLSNTPIYGFDSFEGLQEDWSGTHMPRGHLSLQGRTPKVADNVHLVKGWFEDTLPTFLLEKKNSLNLALIHLDADTYTPTKFVLNKLVDFIKPGCIIIFDEYFGYRNFQNHEFKAFEEFVKENNVKYKYIAFSTIAVAIQVV
jgi:hypothetical protein